jgi:hypothetical protein
MSKRKMVKEAMDKLGDVGPQEIQQYIHDTYGVDMNTGMVSSYKSGIKKQLGGFSGGRAAAESSMVSLRDIAVIRELVTKYGTPQLTQIIKTLAQ